MGQVIIFFHIKEFTDTACMLKPSFCYSLRIIKSLEKTGQYCLRSLPYYVVSFISHLHTSSVFGFEIKGVVAAIGLIYKDYFRDKESAQT